MKLACPKAQFIAALSAVSTVVPTRTPKDILQSVKLSAMDGAATLQGNDSETGIRFEIEGIDVQAGGEVLLPPQRVMAILREMAGDAVRLEAAGDGMWLRGERAEYKLTARDPTGFPDVPLFSDENCYLLPAGLMKQMIRRTVFATDTESTRYALGGVLMDIKDDTATFAATDTRRLAVSYGKVQVQGTPGNEGPLPVVPRKAMDVIERSFTDDAEVIHLALRNNDVLVKTRVATIYSRLVEGRFPKYLDVLNQPTTSHVDFTAGPFYSAVRQAQIVTDNESKGVDFEFTPGTLQLRSRVPDVGESTVELPISYEGALTRITFDPRFIADFLKTLDPGQPLRLQFSDSNSAAVFVTEDGSKYVVMPLSRN
jgi:DNA polymerase-3 subunit beta